MSTVTTTRADELLAALEHLVQIFRDRSHAGTNVDGEWMGVPSWADVEAAEYVVNGGTFTPPED